MQMLIISDLHLGKVMHFRKRGIGIPIKAAEANHRRLLSVAHHFKPKSIVFLGDLFHSDYNGDWEEFRRTRDLLKDVKFDLVVGNHDILSQDILNCVIDEIYEDEMSLYPFSFTHIPQETLGYNLAGHLHPSVMIRSRHKVRMPSVRLPCYYFTSSGGILPAFGSFTGNSELPLDGAHIFLLVDGDVIPYHPK